MAIYFLDGHLGLISVESLGASVVLDTGDHTDMEKVGRTYSNQCSDLGRLPDQTVFHLEVTPNQGSQ